VDFVVFVINFLFSSAYVILALSALSPWLKPLRLVNVLTDPFLRIFRLALPPRRIGFDFAPFVMIMFLWLIQRVMYMALTQVIQGL